MADIEGEYFVFDYYTSQAPNKTCLIPLIVVNGKLQEAERDGWDPQDMDDTKRTNECLRVLRERKVNRIWTCGGNSMYDEVMGFVTHFSGGEGKYAFHYDSVADRTLPGIEIRNFTGQEELSDAKKQEKWKLLKNGLC